MKELDPRTKMMALVSISCAALFTENLLYLTGLLIFSIVFMLAVGVSPAEQKKQFAAAVGTVLFIFILQALFGQWRTGLMLSVRLLIVIMSAEILMTGKPRDYLLAMVQIRLPYELAYMVILAFHFFPILREEALDVSCSIQLRGTELRKIPLRKKLAAYKRICIPVLAGAVERARDTSAAMEARGFRAYRRRTYMRKLKMKKRDIVLTILLPVMALLFILTSCGSDAGGNLGYQAAVSISGENEATVSWSDDEKYEGILECDGEKIKADVTEVREGSYYRYAAAVRNVEADHEYKYRVGDGETMSEENTFSLNNLDNDEMKFMYIGDIQYQLRDRDYEIWGNMLQEAYSSNKDTDLVLTGGDMVDKGADMKDWEAFFSNGEAVFSRIPVMSTIGNHETPGSPEIYLQMMSLPENGPLKEQVYSFDYGPCHFVSLNSCIFMSENMSEEDYRRNIDAVNEWLRSDLKKSRAEWKIVFMHHPLYPVTEDEDLYARIRADWEDILADNGTDLVLCGHQHAYMRTKQIKGVTYIMGYSGEKHSYYLEEGTELPEYEKSFYSEQANYLTAEVSKKKLNITVYNEEGKEIDRCGVEK